MDQKEPQNTSMRVQLTFVIGQSIVIKTITSTVKVNGEVSLCSCGLCASDCLCDRATYPNFSFASLASSRFSLLSLPNVKPNNLKSFAGIAYKSIYL